MESEKFFNYYVEVLTSTLHEALGKNLVFQAQQKINKEEIESLKYTIQDLTNKLNQQVTLQENLSNIGQQLNNKDQEIGNLKEEYDSVKKQLVHIETFKSELVAARTENINLKKQYQKQILELKQKIEYLQMTPAQRRKFDSKNQIQNIETKDGGEF